MKEKNCKGCKREFSENMNVVLYFCTDCERGLKGYGGTDYYEKKTDKSAK